MRDIRPDLRERIAEAERRAAECSLAFDKARAKLEGDHQSEMAGIKRELDALRSLIVIESERTGGHEQPLQKSAELADYLVTLIFQNGPTYKNELKYLAEKAGYFEPGGGGRAVHLTLHNLVQHRKLVKLDDERYDLSPVQIPELLSKMQGTSAEPENG